MADTWWSSWVPAVAPYAVLLRLFVEGSIGADELEILFLRLYKVDPTDWPSELFDVLDRFFADVDAYCGDDRLREEVHGLDAAGLRRRARDTFEELARLAG